MKVITIFILVLVLATQVEGECPQGNKMVERLQKCTTFMQRDDHQNPQCTDMKGGIDCLEELLNDCKDNEAFRRMSGMMNDQLAQARTQIEAHCGCVGVTSSFVLILSACLLSMWFWK